ncbi:MFS transporter [Halioxenophilus sp. WMMB6]|uniref:MFS transporter n=1 Tax=Halioxenophilus sp. WMMB6 TaxID=3073815 RepID=UPI00295EAD62|nr:MFS transporter [Halioxenophilus sp. WMMB6]
MSVRTLIDASPMSRLQLRVMALCFLLNMLDGMDVLAISFAAPAIAEQWSISPQALGIVFSAALVGMTIGALVISPMTDKVGRRRMILASLCMVAVAMVATSAAQSVWQLALLRLLAGLGIGSMLASLTALVAEYSPDAKRNQAILVLHAAYPVGAIIAGFVAAWIVPHWGWRPLFVLAGLVSAVVIPLVFWGLPESLDFLAHRQPANALVTINRILQKMAHAPLPELPAPVAEEGASVGVAALLAPNIRAATLLLWLAFMMSFATLYFLFSWVVKLAVEAGLDVSKAMLAGISLNLGAFFGSISLGLLSARFGLARTISLFFFCAAAMSVAYGNLQVSVLVILVLIFLLMYFVQGGFTGLYAVAARLYPTEIRTTGVGWAIGAGRLGAIAGPAVAGFILGAGVPIGWTFILFSLPLVVAGLVIVRLKGVA